MSRRLLAFACLLALTGAASFAPAAARSRAQAAPATRLGVMAYFRPGDDWQRLIGGAPTVAYVVLNPATGPGDQKDDGYAAEVAAAQQAGITVLGYVHTAYGTRSASAVEAEIDDYFTWYGVDGIFLDEVSIFCDYEQYYQNLYDYVKTVWNQGMVVLDPGWQSDASECYLQAADVLVTFEGSYETYTSNFPAVAWTARYPSSRFWHLVYNVPTPAAVRYTLGLSLTRNVSTVYLSPEQMPNPWDALPAADYWAAELGTETCATAAPPDGSLSGVFVQFCLPPVATADRPITLQASAVTADTRPPDDATFTWDFGDGRTAQGQQVTHTYAAPGLYHVRVTVVRASDPQEPTVADDYLAVLAASAAGP
ncbi:MAG TPA: spherulation-specific family 4 protein [Dehalococcoidia bacterium]|nr:spherulation-specific family 4 protein [Dehalococcoidia bacterium]